GHSCWTCKLWNGETVAGGAHAVCMYDGRVLIQATPATDCAFWNRDKPQPPSPTAPVLAAAASDVRLPKRRRSCADECGKPATANNTWRRLTGTHVFCSTTAIDRSTTYRPARGLSCCTGWATAPSMPTACFGATSRPGTSAGPPAMRA